jgi:hypothetical protein
MATTRTDLCTRLKPLALHHSEKALLYPAVMVPPAAFVKRDMRRFEIFYFSAGRSFGILLDRIALVARPFLRSISLRVFFDSGYDLVPLL